MRVHSPSSPSFSSTIAANAMNRQYTAMGISLRLKLPDDFQVRSLSL